MNNRELLKEIREIELAFVLMGEEQPDVSETSEMVDDLIEAGKLEETTV